MIEGSGSREASILKLQSQRQARLLFRQVRVDGDHDTVSGPAYL
jgi:hypothetical protein